MAVITSIRGETLEVGADSVVIECAGLGYRVKVLPSSAATAIVGNSMRLITSFIVREDAHMLYGFADREVCDLFDILRTVSGVGPKLAMAVLSVLEPAQLRRAIAEADLTTLTKVPGVGKRVAERLTLELKEKVCWVDDIATPREQSGDDSLVRNQVIEGLIGLGFALKNAELATDSVLHDDPSASPPVALRGALSLLGNNR